MEAIILFIKLNIIGILIFVGVILALTILVMLLKYTTDSKVLNIINAAEKVVDSGVGKDKKRYVISTIYTTYPWLRVLLSKEAIGRYVDSLVGVANKVYDLSGKEDGRQEITDEETEAMKRLIIKIINDEFNDDK